MAKLTKKGPSQTPGASVTADPRFQAVHTDPRFQRFPKARRHVEIDERFAGVFTDPNFQAKTPVDKRGRKVSRRKQKDDMRRYYRIKDQGAAALDSAQDELDAPQSRGSDAVGAPLEADDEVVGDEAAGAAVPSGSHGGAEEEDLGAPGDSEMDSADEGAEAERRWARLRGLEGPEASSSEEEEDEEGDEGGGGTSAEEDEEEVEAQLLREFGPGAMAANPAEVVPQGEESRRMALVDLDWERLRAVDILAVMRSFAPKGGRVLRVTVYPSDYGLQRMRDEASLGPTGIYKSASRHTGAVRGSSKGRKPEQHAVGSADIQVDSDDEDDELALASQSSEDDEGGSSSVEQNGSESESGDEVDKHRLMLYEKAKLRYYYAVMECDTVATAAHIYRECDGMEYQFSANVFDLRYVPDEQSFEGREARDSAAEIPIDYTPPSFQTVALQHTNAQLTWDADDDTRKRTLKKRMTADSIREDDFKAYLASSEEESDAEEAEAEAADPQAKYRALLLGGGSGATEGRGGGKGWATANAVGGDEDDPDAEPSTSGQEEGGGQAGAKERKGMEMEVSFVPGLEGLGARLLAAKRDKQARQSESIWEAMQRRRREKKRAAMELGRKYDSEEEEDSDPEVASGADEAAAGEDPFFQHEDDPFSDPFFQDDEASEGAAAKATLSKAAAGGKGTGHDKKGKRAEQTAKKDSKAARRVEALRRAELELLLLDDSALQDTSKLGLNHKAEAEGDEANKKAKVSRKQKMKEKKRLKLRERATGSDDEDLGVAARSSFKMDVRDERFKAVFEDANFALDPVDPRFVASEGAAALAAEVARKGAARRDAAAAAGRAAGPAPATTAPQDAPADTPSQGTAMQLKAMVASLKRKSVGASAVAANGMPVAASGKAASKLKKKRRKEA